MPELVSPYYLNQLTLLHGSRTWGASGYSHANIVATYRRKIGAKTVLDFGCGRATLKKALLKADRYITSEDITEFDPALSDKNSIPIPADLLVANDVLEHIEPDRLELVLAYIRSLAIKGAYFTICLDPSKVSLPDGRNAHLIVQPKDWWLTKLKEAGFEIVKAQMRKGLWVWAK